jgi:hypothetical protein
MDYSMPIQQTSLLFTGIHTQKLPNSPAKLTKMDSLITNELASIGLKKQRVCHDWPILN